MWILDCLDEIESDLSVHHGIFDLDDLSGPCFFKFAEQLPTYGGAVENYLLKDSPEVEYNQPSQMPTVPSNSTNSGEKIQTVPSNIAKIHKGFQGDDHNPPVFGPRKT